MGRKFSRTTGNETGFSLIEIIISIVLIGIAVPTFSNYFGGLDDSKQPEYFTEAVFLATRQLEGIRNETLTRIPAAANYPTCVAFQTSPPVGANFNIDCTSTDYGFSWLVEDVNALNPNVDAGTFGKKVTLTVSRTATGAMPSFQLVTLF